jgi:hypothetical protein
MDNPALAVKAPSILITLPVPLIVAALEVVLEVTG